MKLPSIALCGAAILYAQSAQAVEVTGGSIGLSYSAFTEDTDISRFGIEGSVEVGFNRNISLQFDIGHDKLNATGVDSTTLGLHGIYHVDDQTSLGAFYTREDISGSDVDIVGIEGGFDTGQMEYDAYMANADSVIGNGTLLGIAGRYEFANGLGLSGAYDSLDVSVVDLSKITVKLDRDVAENANLFLEVGTGKANVVGITGSEFFVGVGGKITFGADRGATFERRGVAKLLPGF